MFRKEDDPPAIVREAEETSVSAIEQRAIEAHGNQQRHMRFSLEFAKQVGDQLIKLKTRIPHGGFKSRIEAKMTFSYDQAKKYMRIAREWGKLSKGDSECPFGSIDEACRFLVEDAPDEDVTPKGDVPFAPSGNGTKPPETATEREAGDEAAFDETAAKIAAMLCPRCKRIGSPSCGRCQGKAFKIQNRLADAPAPTGGKGGGKGGGKRKSGENPNNGRPFFDFVRYRSEKTKFLAVADSLTKAYGMEFSPERAAIDKAIEKLDQLIKAAYEKWSGQKVPQNT